MPNIMHTTSTNPPPIFTRRLHKLPAHVSQSDDLQYLTCHICRTTTNLAYEPNFYSFLNDHEHRPTLTNSTGPKPWPYY